MFIKQFKQSKSYQSLIESTMTQKASKSIGYFEHSY